MAKTSVEFRAAQARKRQGLPLTEQDRKALVQQELQYENRTAKIYFESAEQAQQWQAQAKTEGYTRFSSWVVAKVKSAVSGEFVDPVAHGRLQAKVQALEQDVEYHRRRTQEFEEENRDLKAETRRLTNEITDLTQWLRNQPTVPKKARA